MISLLIQIWKQIAAAVAKLSIVQKDVQELKAGQKLTLQKLEQVLNALLPDPAVTLIFIAELEGQVTYGATTMEMTTHQQVHLSIQPVDKRGNPAKVDGVPVWLTSNSEIVSLAVAADGMSADASAVGPLGRSIVSVTADADLGQGTVELVGAIDIDITPSGAVSLTITAGVPADQEDAEPSTRRARG